MSNIPKNLKYTNDHEWILIHDDGTATVGITDYAQESLGDVTFVEVPEVGDSFEKGDSFGVVESVKAASDLYMPVSGEVIEINESLEDDPQFVNQSPYEKGWMVKIKVSDSSQIEGLLDSVAYSALV